MNELETIKVISKKSIGVVPVYDLSVGEEHNYILGNNIVSHNSGMIFASSIVVAIKKLKLKEDEDGNKTSQVHGIRSSCKVIKSRYAKPFESVQIKIPYESGMDPTSGLVDFFEAHNKLKKVGNRLEYTSPVTGEVTLMFRKAWESNKDNMLHVMMDEFDVIEEVAEVLADDVNDEDDDTLNTAEDESSE